MPLIPSAALVRPWRLPSVDGRGVEPVRMRSARGTGVPGLPTPVNSLKCSSRTGRSGNAACRRPNVECRSLRQHNRAASSTTSLWLAGPASRGPQGRPGRGDGTAQQPHAGQRPLLIPVRLPSVGQPVAEQHANPRPGLTVAKVARLPRQPGVHRARQWAGQVAREGTPGYTGRAPVSSPPR